MTYGNVKGQKQWRKAPSVLIMEERKAEANAVPRIRWSEKADLSVLRQKVPVSKNSRKRPQRSPRLISQHKEEGTDNSARPRRVSSLTKLDRNPEFLALQATVISIFYTEELFGDKGDPSAWQVQDVFMPHIQESHLHPAHNSEKNAGTSSAACGQNQKGKEEEAALALERRESDLGHSPEDPLDVSAFDHSCCQCHPQAPPPPSLFSTQW